MSLSNLSLVEKLTPVLIILIVLLIVAPPIVSLFGGAIPDYSTGSRSGIVDKFSERGLIFKSYEGELKMNGYDRDENGAMVPKVFAFSVDNKQVADQINKALDSGEKVVLHYNQYFIGPVTLQTKYHVNKITYMEGNIAKR